MDTKDILLILIGFVGAVIIVYCSFIEPVIDGISRYGLYGFIIKAIGFVAAFIVLAAITHYNE